MSKGVPSEGGYRALKGFARVYTGDFEGVIAGINQTTEFFPNNHFL